MFRYPEERCQAVAHPLSTYGVAEQESISIVTFCKSRIEVRVEGRCLSIASGQGVGNQSSLYKFPAVVESAVLDVEQISQYRRWRGVFPEQVERWRHDYKQLADLSHEDQRHRAVETKSNRRRIPGLERELKRKDAALADTVVLLTLSKKGMGDLENED